MSPGVLGREQQQRQHGDVPCPAIDTARQSFGDRRPGQFEKARLDDDSRKGVRPPLLQPVRTRAVPARRSCHDRRPTRPYDLSQDRHSCGPRRTGGFIAITGRHRYIVHRREPVVFDPCGSSGRLAFLAAPSSDPGETIVPSVTTARQPRSSPGRSRTVHDNGTHADHDVVADRGSVRTIATAVHRQSVAYRTRKPWVSVQHAPS